MANDIYQALMGLDSGVAVPQGDPLLQSENPMAYLAQLPAATVPAATPPPQLTYNPGGTPVQSLEELMFQIGGVPNG